MKQLVFDTEANGLLDTVTKVWCIAGTCIQTEEDVFLDVDELSKESISPLFDDYDLIIGHNIINYDIPLLKKMYNIDLYERFEPCQIHDTYLMSRLSFPDRQLPEGCPSVIRSEKTKKAKKVGPHSLEALGYSVGARKIQIDDWEVYDEEIVKRCLTDVRINIKVYHKLLKEMNLNEYYN